ncbi:MAG: hypothetical protein ACLPZR_28405 [Solirubrobacteraceae bacterium]
MSDHRASVRPDRPLRAVRPDRSLRAGEFCNPFSFENPSPLAASFAGERPRKRSAETRLDRARLLRGEKLAYVLTSATSGAFC